VIWASELARGMSRSLFGQKLACCLSVLFLLAGPSIGRADQASRFNYVVLASGQPIGSHQVHIESKGNQLVVEVESNLDFSIGPLSVFQLEHQRRELWRDRRLVESIAHTVENDKIRDIKITREATGYKREVNGRVDEFQDPVRILALWHEDLFKHDTFVSPMQDKLYPLSVEFIGREWIEIGGQQVHALHYRMTGDSERDLWYDEPGHVLMVRLHDYSLVIDYVLDRGNSQEAHKQAFLHRSSFPKQSSVTWRNTWQSTK